MGKGLFQVLIPRESKQLLAGTKILLAPHGPGFMNFSIGPYEKVPRPNVPTSSPATLPRGSCDFQEAHDEHCRVRNSAASYQRTRGRPRP
jgi:hypothetical protein